jgi:sulfite reductase alpha subunit-like flavoprotein
VTDVYVPLWIQSHAYAHLPKDPTVPLILIGPGTGCAMFKAILEEKLSLSTQGEYHIHTHIHTQYTHSAFVKE